MIIRILHLWRHARLSLDTWPKGHEHTAVPLASIFFGGWAIQTASLRGPSPPDTILKAKNPKGIFCVSKRC